MLMRAELDRMILRHSCLRSSRLWLRPSGSTKPRTSLSFMMRLVLWQIVLGASWPRPGLPCTGILRPLANPETLKTAYLHVRNKNKNTTANGNGHVCFQKGFEQYTNIQTQIPRGAGSLFSKLHNCICSKFQDLLRGA